MKKLLLPILIFTVLTILVSIDLFAFDKMITRNGRTYFSYKHITKDVTDMCKDKFPNCTDKELDNIVEEFYNEIIKAG